MSRYYNWYPPYVSAAEKKRRNEKMAATLSKGGNRLAPVVISGNKIAKQFWGKAWCDNVESYQDYSNRLPRGRSYVRAGAVIDLQITTGKVTALVSGSASKPYEISIDIQPMAPGRWDALKKKCLGKISSLLALVQGKLPQEILAEFCNRDTGLFPSPKEIKTSCSCPDWAGLCKHLAAVFYGIGARLDDDPKLFFTLRGIQESELVGSEVIGTLTEGVTSEIAADNLATVFDMELDSLEGSTPAKLPAKKASVAAVAVKELSVGQPPWTSIKIKGLRKQLGLTQAAFGKLCEVPAITISLWEHGKPVPERCWKTLDSLLPEKPKATEKTAEKTTEKVTGKAVSWNAAKIKQLRQQLGLTQTAFGKRCEVTAATVSHWESGKHPVIQSYWKKLDTLAAKKQAKPAKKK